MPDPTTWKTPRKQAEDSLYDRFRRNGGAGWMKEKCRDTESGAAAVPELAILSMCWEWMICFHLGASCGKRRDSSCCDKYDDDWPMGEEAALPCWSSWSRCERRMMAAGGSDAGGGEFHVVSGNGSAGGIRRFVLTCVKRSPAGKFVLRAGTDGTTGTVQGQGSG